MPFTLNDFYFDLPEKLIARHPLPVRSTSRFLCLKENKATKEKEAHELEHRYFFELTDLVHPGDLLVFNDTKVIPARLFSKKVTGGLVEILVERVLDNERLLAQLRASKPLKMGEKLWLAENTQFKILRREAQFFELQLIDKHLTVLQVVEKMGQVPLPPYLHRLPEESDLMRYQTIYAKYPGSVAAPTAGFHFDEPLLQALQHKNIEFAYLTLHIGAGTFSPVRTSRLDEHQMHAEKFSVSEKLCAQIKAVKARGNRVIAIGTTSMRALESASQSGEICPFEGETNIFIYPGYAFRCADVLITNMHLPCSSLLMLVCAFGGHQQVMRAYDAAVQEAYRFYSYGDAMWVSKKTEE